MPVASRSAVPATAAATEQSLHLAISLAQTLVVGQVLFGLILLAQHHRAHDKLHYAYGTFALLAVFAPFLYAPSDPRARLLWFGIALLLAGALGVRAYMTAT